MRGGRGTPASGGDGKKAAGPSGVAPQADVRLGLMHPMFPLKQVKDLGADTE